MSFALLIFVVHRLLLLPFMEVRLEPIVVIIPVQTLRELVRLNKCRLPLYTAAFSCTRVRFYTLTSYMHCQSSYVCVLQHPCLAASVPCRSSRLFRRRNNIAPALTVTLHTIRQIVQAHRQTLPESTIVRHTGTKDHASHSPGCYKVGAFFCDQKRERGARAKICEIAATYSVSKQRLGCQNEDCLTEFARHLAPKHVKVLAGVGAFITRQPRS